MKTFKVYFRTNLSETVEGQNIALDESGNLTIGDNIFAAGVWSHVLYMYGNAVSSRYDSPNAYYDDELQFDPTNTAPAPVGVINW